jgi:ferredoxin-NADP reductase
VSELVLRVAGVRRATPGARIVRVALDGGPFTYRAGQVAMIGPAGAASKVPYSIASAPAETRQHGLVEFLIRTDGHGVWGTHFPPLRRGMRLAVRGPLGSFTFPERPRERRFLFIAGGTGISPLRAMIKEAVLTGRPGRIRLLYSARTPGDFAYARELRGMARRGEIELALTATREIPPRWRGARGRIAPEQLAPMVDHPDTLCFVCGPEAMVSEVPPMLRALGISASRIRLEEW